MMRSCSLLLALLPLMAHSFVTLVPSSRNLRLWGATTIEAPPSERVSEDILGDAPDDDDDDYDDLEYLIDSEEFRDFEDPFHILLMGSTFENPKLTVAYAATSLEYVLGMPPDEGLQVCRFAKDEGFACLGTWPRHECLTLGRELQRRDLQCRVVPFCEGGQRGWQAKKGEGEANRVA